MSHFERERAQPVIEASSDCDLSVQCAVSLGKRGEMARGNDRPHDNLRRGPAGYLAHEAAWNFYHGPTEAEVAVPYFSAESASGRRIVISRAPAKTITFRTIATIMDFTTLYAAVGDVATAVGLSAFGLIIGLSSISLIRRRGAISRRPDHPPALGSRSSF